MKSLWSEQEAAQAQSGLDLRVYTSRLLGRDDSLVLHGGGNTSYKGETRNIFGDRVETLFVKGSGWDLKTIEAQGFAPVCQQTLLRLAELPEMSDTEMTRELKSAQLDPAAPSPSVEAILHALVPFRYVDHTHADAVVAVSNSPDGEQLLREIYGDDVLVLPYIMPGFILARQVAEATRSLDWSRLRGIVLMHHGVFTFADEARASYEAMIELVSDAEQLLELREAPAQVRTATAVLGQSDCLELAALRRQVCDLASRPMICALDSSEQAAGYSLREDIRAIATRGPLTPDHTLHTRRIPAIFSADDPVSLDRFAGEYHGYFDRHGDDTLTCLDPAPRVVIWPGRGVVAIGPNPGRAGIVADIAEHTARAVQWAEALGGWQALPEAEIFLLEYWELEQAKLKRLPAPAAFEGRVALVTGAASGIGRACLDALVAEGCAVIALDIDPAVSALDGGAVAAMACDVTDAEAVQGALQAGILRFGGLDILVSNAGSFPPSAVIESLDELQLDQSLRLNFTSHARLLRDCVPYLKRGCNPSVVLVASRNVPAPGPGASAYSAAKAALTQLGRIAALELGGDGVRVNMVHPDAVYDTGVWSEPVLAERAAAYGMTVEDYRRRNTLGREVTAAEVARAVVALTGDEFTATTGAQIPIDGGNDRVI
jgi:rhamnose utilization protein RhaD (predicted bifunctional aldolase and dehydrogenase)/NAD(P)-dependent dehydrogenase (short-subunit alcohol dehydrogenase family)